MSTISVSLPVDGSTADVADVNTPITTIVNLVNGNLDNANIKTNAAIDPLKISGGTTGMFSTYQSYTPTLANCTVGNGTVTSYYVQIGKTVIYRGNFSLGSTSAVTGSVTISLPVTANSNGQAGEFALIGNGVVGDALTAVYPCTPEYLTNTTMRLSYFTTVGGNVVNNTKVAAGAPINFGTGDYIQWAVCYDAP